LSSTTFNCAVAVRSPSGLFTIGSIVRRAAGDVYVNFPRPGLTGSKPHTSYHASGQHHHKTYGHAMMVRYKQRPDANFQDVENVVTIGVAQGDAEKLGVPCNPADYSHVFEIPAGDVRGLAKGGSTMLSVDISTPGGRPIVTPGARIVQHVAYHDTIPWVLVTFFDPP
jgi:hypothetical protein